MAACPTSQQPTPADDNPDVGGTLPDTPQWRFAFQTRYRAVLAALRSQLGSDVEIRDEGRLPT